MSSVLVLVRTLKTFVYNLVFFKFVLVFLLKLLIDILITNRILTTHQHELRYHPQVETSGIEELYWVPAF